jgi:hypothetical protein
MAKELQDIKNPVAPQDALYAIAKAWKSLFGEFPTRKAAQLLLAHTTLECGSNWKSCHNYNLGNIKYTDKRISDYVYFKCNEIVPKSSALKYVANKTQDSNCYISKDYGNGTVLMWFEPKHIACKFVAFETLEEGCVFYISFLKNRYKTPFVWNAIERGDVADFCHQLRVNKYYTADETQYTTGVVRVFKQFDNLSYDVNQFQNYELTDGQVQQIKNNVYASLQDLADEV